MTARRLNAEMLALLAGDPWFAGLPEPVRAGLAAAGNLRMLARGQAVFRQGDPPTGLHATLGSAIHVSAVDSDGKDCIMAIARPGQWIGFLPCLDGRPHLYSGTMADNGPVFSIVPADVARIFEVDVATYRLLERPELTVARKLSQFIVEDMTLPLANRVALRLADLGRWAYGAGSSPVAPLDTINQAELALALHASRQKVNPVLRTFAAQGWIATGHGSIRILDTDALARFGRRRPESPG